MNFSKKELGSGTTRNVWCMSRLRLLSSMLAPKWSGKTVNAIKVLIIRAKLLMSDSIEELVSGLVAKTMT